MLAFQFDGVRYDCGSKLGYPKATISSGLRHPETGGDFAAYLSGRFGAEGRKAAKKVPAGALEAGSETR